MKKTTKTTTNKYDEKGNLLECIETIIEEEIQENKYIPNKQVNIQPKWIVPQVGDYPSGR